MLDCFERVAEERKWAANKPLTASKVSECWTLNSIYTQFRAMKMCYCDSLCMASLCCHICRQQSADTFNHVSSFSLFLSLKHKGKKYEPSELFSFFCEQFAIHKHNGLIVNKWIHGDWGFRKYEKRKEGTKEYSFIGDVCRRIHASVVLLFYEKVRRNEDAIEAPVRWRRWRR